MNVHELTLQNYSASSGCPSACQPTLYLGTAGSYGNEQINVVLGEGWQGLTVKAVFQPCGVAVVIPNGGGVISVPWEATQSVIAYPKGRIVFEGVTDGRVLISTDIPYAVGSHSDTEGSNSQPPTPSQWEQFMDEVRADADRAEQAAKDAEAAVQKVTDAGTQAVTDIGNAKDSALEAIDAAREEAAGSISADVEGAKQAAADAEQSAADAEQSAKDAADALTNVQAAGKSALDDIATERQNTLSDLQNEGAKQQSAVAGAGTAALEAIGQTEQAAINQIKQTGETQVSAVQSAGTTQISQINSAGAAQVQAVKDEGAAQTSALDDAAAAHKTELEAIASHPPQPNTATGKWQVWNAETGAYQDTDALYQGGYYTPAVSDDGVLTWQGSQAGMPSLPSANVKGPKGDKGDPGLGVPSPTQSDAGKVPMVNEDGTGYVLREVSAGGGDAGQPGTDGEDGGYYTPSVDTAGNLSWTPSKVGMPSVPEANIRGPQGLQGETGATPQLTIGTVTTLDPGGDATVTITGTAEAPVLNFGIPKGEPGEDGSAGLPTPTAADAGKALAVKPDGTGYQLAGPYAPLSAAIRPAASGNPVSITDSVEWPLQGLKVYGKSTQDGTPSPENPVPIVSAGDGGSIGLTVSDGADQSQSLTISTPNGLPGIPVNSGGNYTDASGQQLVCNEIDYAREVYVQHCALEKVIGTPNFIETADRPGRYAWANVLANTYGTGSAKILSTFGKWLNWGIGDGISVAINGTTILFNYLKSNAANEVNDIFSNLIEANQCYVLGQLAAPIETPISPEELTAYRTLHTYNGTTVVSTAEDVAGLEVKYLADAQKYIDNRLTAAESHIQEIAAAQLNAQTGG